MIPKSLEAEPRKAPGRLIQAARTKTDTGRRPNRARASGHALRVRGCRASVPGCDRPGGSYKVICPSPYQDIFKDPLWRTVTAASRLVAATDWSWIASRVSFEDLALT
jgi:hypothetical protein